MEKRVFVPSDVPTPVPSGKPVEPNVANTRADVPLIEALNITAARSQHLRFIMDDILSKRQRKAEAMLDIANHPDLTDLEKTFMGYKLFEMYLKRIPGGSLLASRL